MLENQPVVAEISDETIPPETQTPASTIDPAFKAILDSHAVYSSPYSRNDNKEVVDIGHRAMHGAVAGIAPKDTIEGMLATILTGLYNTTMTSICRTATTHDFDKRNAEFNNVSKLSRSFATVLEAFNHYRGKGMTQQDINVHYHNVNVADGGQAIVGNVTPQGRGAGEIAE